MRAKLIVTQVTPATNGTNTVQETVSFIPVTDAPFDSTGASEDNDFARWTPGGNVSLTISNPALFGRFKLGQKFYADFTEAK